MDFDQTYIDSYIEKFGEKNEKYQPTPLKLEMGNLSSENTGPIELFGLGELNIIKLCGCFTQCKR